jgi:hypothetical protein
MISQAFSLLLLIFSTLFITVSGDLYARELSVAGMNIRFYGREIVEDQFVQDSRTPYLASYIEDNLGAVDVISFEEIVDQEGFVKNVLKNKRICQGYANPDAGHQHVMICYKKDFEFIPANFDTDFIIEEATLGRRLRPIVHGILTDKAGVHLAYIAAVHLKASPQDAAVRMKQIEILTEKMRDLEPLLPAIIVGDFNTFASDVEDFTDTFNRAGLKMRNVFNANNVTFKTPRLASKLDHFWVNDAVTANQPVSTSDICRNNAQQVVEYDSIEEYNKRISDHCYIKSSFEIRDSDATNP